MPTYETSNTVAILAAGRNPVWVEQTLASVADYDGAPSTGAHGVDLGNVVQCMFFVQLRTEVHRRTALYTIGTFDAASTYRVTINALNIDSTGANLAALIADIISDVNGSAQAGNVTASQVSGSTTTVKIVGDIEADFSIAISVSGGTGTSTCTADPSTATARLYLMGASPNSPGRASGADSGDAGAWAIPDDGEFAVTYRNLLDRVTVAGCERLYVELDDIAGHASDGGTVTYTPHVFLGPCAVEA